jgi:protein translocase SEC61 complex gamma subunit
MSNYPHYEKYSKYDKGKKLSIYERFGVFFQNSKRIIKIANKPNRKEYLLIFKICGIGLLVLGALSFVIQIIWTIINQMLHIG